MLHFITSGISSGDFMYARFCHLIFLNKHVKTSTGFPSFVWFHLVRYIVFPVAPSINAGKISISEQSTECNYFEMQIAPICYENVHPTRNVINGGTIEQRCLYLSRYHGLFKDTRIGLQVVF